MKVGQTDEGGGNAVCRWIFTEGGGSASIRVGRSRTEGGGFGRRLSDTTYMLVARPIMLIALAMTLVSLGSSLFVEPWSNRHMREVISAASADLMSFAVQSGAFKRVSKNLYIQIDEQLPGGDFGGIFIVDLRDPQMQLIYYAKRGAVRAVGDDHRAVSFWMDELASDPTAGDDLTPRPSVPRDLDVDVAIVDKGLDVFRDLAFHVAEVDVPDTVPASDFPHGLVYVTRRHLLQRTQAELGAIGTAIYNIEQTAVFFRLVDQPCGAAHGFDRRIIRMRGKTDSRTLGDRHQLLQEAREAIPDLVGGHTNRRRVPHRVAIAHVPEDPVRQRVVEVDLGGVEPN